MDFGILGPLEVRDGGEVIKVAGVRQRALLTLLLLHPSQPLSVDRLIEDIWGGRPPREATKSLQMQVARLRRALGDGAYVVETVPGGYRLNASQEALDLSRFERLAERGRRLADAGSVAEAAHAFAAALAEWRGRPLDDVAYAPFAQADIGRLEELRLSTLEAMIDAELALGRHAEWIGRLEALTAEHPFRERLHAQAIVALYRAGRQAEALDVYQKVRARLNEELGLEPSRRLHELQAAVLTHNPTLDWVPGRDTSGPAARRLPAGLRDDTDFVGRRDECDGLGRAWNDVGRGWRRLVLVAGEPGIGKTRLAARMAARVRSEGGAVLYGRCDEHLALPYRAWIDVLGQCVDGAADDVLKAHVSTCGGAVARLAPGLAQRVHELPAPQASEPEVEQYLLFEAATGLLRAAGDKRPLLIVLDDLHWADRPTLALLRHVISRGEDMRALVLCTFRDSEFPVGGPLADTLAALYRETGVERMTLSGLEERDVVTLVQGRSGHELAKAEVALARDLARETSGNPFFLGELLRHHAESGAIRRDPTGWQLASERSRPPVPDSVREVIGHRVHRLGATTAEVLRTAAVIGIEFELPLVAAVLGRSPQELLDPLDVARRAKLVREVQNAPNRYCFEHALVNHTLRLEIGAMRRAQMHERIARLLEDRRASHPGELAYHWTEAGAQGEAIRASRRAGEHALEALAPDEAVRWFTHALALQREHMSADAAVECDLLIGLGEAQRRAGAPVYRATLLEACRLARELRDGDRLADATLANSRGFESASGQVDEPRVRELRAALELSHDAYPLRRARLLALLALELTFVAPLEKRRVLSDQAVRLASDDPSTLASVLWARHAVLWTPDLLAEHCENAAALERIAAHVGDPVIAFWAACDTVLTSVWRADLGAADAALKEMAAVANRVGQPILSWVVAWYSAWRAHLAGRLEEAEALAHRAAELGQASGQPDALAFLTDQLTAIRWDQGRLPEQLPMLERVVAAHPGLPIFRSWLALAYCELARHHDARSAIEPSVAADFADVPHDIVWLSTVCLYAEVCARLKAPEPASVLYTLIAPFADQIAFNASSVLGSAHWFLARLAATVGDGARAARHGACAEAAHKRLGAPLLVARDSRVIPVLVAAQAGSAT